jgi:hypothetical protein
MTAGSVLTNASPRAQHLCRSLLAALRPVCALQEELKCLIQVDVCPISPIECY